MLRKYFCDRKTPDALLRQTIRRDRRTGRIDFANYLAAERRTPKLRSRAIDLILGQLQTPEYAMSLGIEPAHDRLRAIRQEISLRRGLVLHAILGEAALLGKGRDPEMMYRQRQRILERSALENITISVLPDDPRPAWPLQLGGVVTLAILGAEDAVEAGYLEGYVGERDAGGAYDVYRQNPRFRNACLQVWRDSASAALSPNQSRDFIISLQEAA